MKRVSSLIMMALLLGCSGRSVETVTLPSAANAGSAGSTGGVSAGDAGAVASGGAGASGGAAGGGEAGASCQSDAECPGGAPCTVGACNDGHCQQRQLPRGTPIAQDSPADCRSLVCDGAGATLQVIDMSNVPVASDPCWLGVCSEEAMPSLVAGPAGLACDGSFGSGRCDGNGSCVKCLTAADCAAGAACVAHACTSVSCSNAVRDGDETDVDCGGSCARCSDGSRCAIDQDCASDDCDSLWLVCLPHSCIDQSQDGAETDLDCGGSVCAGCYSGKKCLVNTDCATNKCDPLQHLCGGNPCADQRRDGDESDVDCGGFYSYCPPCQTGQKCQTGFDCAGGLLCARSAGGQGYCQ